MHKYGYNFFTIPQLTIGEIDCIQEAFNREQEAQRKVAQKHKNKKGKR